MKRAQPQERQTLIEELEPTIPPQVRATWLKAMRGAPSRATAIKAKCLECANFSRAEVRDCTVLSCPLWLYRPYQT